MKKILFVCTGNVFRSMSAEWLAKKYIEDNNIKDVEVGSAGTRPWGNSPFSETIERLQEHGADPSKHVQREVSKELLKEYDAIIVMTKNHHKYLMQKFNKDSVLFNYLAHGVNEDLYDENEYGNIYGFDFNMKDYIYNTVDHIFYSIPLIVEKVRIKN